MKISVVTISYHDGERLMKSRQSVLAQQLPEDIGLEHVMVVSDEDFEPAPYAGARVLHITPRGCYDALNAGLQACTGDVIGLLHGNDFYPDDNVLADVAEAFADPGVDVVYGDIYYTCADGTGQSRYWSTAKFHPGLLEYGFMPPHPSVFIRRRVFEEIGLYSTDYIIAADYEYLLRIFGHRPGYGFRRIDRALVAMSPGGISASLRSRLFINLFEKYKALKCVSGTASYLKLLGRYYYHFFQ